MSENHQFKLYYFDIRCRGELPRLLFTFSNTEFEDFRVPVDQWTTFKPQMPMGQLPVLEVDGKEQICQSSAICSYLARELGLSGGNSLEEAKAHMLMDGVNDIWTRLRPVYMAKITGKMEEMKEKWTEFNKEHFQTFLNQYQKFLEQAKTVWIASDKVTWADLGLAEFLSCVRDSFCPEALQDRPLLAEFVDKVLALPQIKPYIDSRKEVSF